MCRAGGLHAAVRREYRRLESDADGHGVRGHGDSLAINWLDPSPTIRGAGGRLANGYFEVEPLR